MQDRERDREEILIEDHKQAQEERRQAQEDRKRNQKERLAYQEELKRNQEERRKESEERAVKRATLTGVTDALKEFSEKFTLLETRLDKLAEAMTQLMHQIGTVLEQTSQTLANTTHAQGSAKFDISSTSTRRHDRP